MRQQAVIENPILNSPFEEPQRHFRFDEHGITSQIVEQRRPSSYFIPIAQPKKKGKDRQLTIEGWTEDRIETNKTVNDIRQRVRLWREGGYPDVTRTTARLLEHWRDPERSRRLFFCQIEALETLIYITETAKKYGDVWIENDLRQFNANANPELFRMALKMATGSGKTVVMAMLIAWQTLNKLANRQDARFSDAFLIVSPGITIRDRLRVLLPSDPQNYYRGLEIVPSDLMGELGKAQIIITNFHAFGRRERVQAAKLTKAILTQGEESPFVESEGEMVRRACRGLGNKKNIVVINDEAHHCYRRRQEAESEDGEKLKGDERKEAERRDEEARIWISGLEAVKRKLGVKTVYDLSATPFFLRGSGYKEGTLFPWVVSDFSLIDAIESGIVKVPRVPVADNSMEGQMPAYRDLWLRIRDDLPKKGRGQQKLAAEPNLPAPLEGALQSLYANYSKYYERWQANTEARADGLTPPVFIVVCNNTNVSKMVFDYIAGWEKPLAERRNRGRAGQAAAVQQCRGRSLHRAAEHDSGRFRATRIGRGDERRVQATCRPRNRRVQGRLPPRFPGRDADGLTDEDLLREVMNTVGKQGKLGEQIKCVVSVSMLTEGWDANTVTHILGVRAFGTQLLCEQVVGRGLRRMSYSPEPVQVKTPSGIVEIEAFPVEYAEVYGVPFSFISSSGAGGEVKPGPQPTHVRALEDRIDCEITFPRIDGYRYELPAERLTATFDETSQLALTTAHVPTRVEGAPIVGETSIHSLDDLKKRREQEVVFLLAKLVLGKILPRRTNNNVKPWLFPDLLAITRRWLAECVTLKDNTFTQLLLFAENAHDAADRIYQAIVAADPGEKRLLPIPKPYDTLGSTRYVSFDTVRPTYRTDPRQCHVSHVAGDTESWEQKMAETLEDMDEVRAYVKNQGLGFTIPYTLSGQQHAYIPDFIVRIDDGGERRPAEPDFGSQRQAQQRQRGQSCDRPHALGSGRQQRRHLGPLGLHRNQRSVGREKHDPQQFGCGGGRADERRCGIFDRDFGFGL